MDGAGHQTGCIFLVSVSWFAEERARDGRPCLRRGCASLIEWRTATTSRPVTLSAAWLPRMSARGEERGRL
jgi:hypothetical protein